MTVTKLPRSKITITGELSADVFERAYKEAVEFLFRHDCQLIIIACNTASAEALRKIQQEYLPKKYPNRRVLGVIIPTCEVALDNRKCQAIGVLATESTVKSGSYIREIHKINHQVRVYQQSAPLLVTLIENNGLKWIDPILDEYLKPLLERHIDCLILGCTHYPIIKEEIRKKLDNQILVMSQDEIIPNMRISPWILNDASSLPAKNTTAPIARNVFPAARLHHSTSAMG